MKPERLPPQLRGSPEKAWVPIVWIALAVAIWKLATLMFR